MTLAAVVIALFFHAIGLPTDVQGPGFDLEGYTVPSGCIFAFRNESCIPQLVTDPSFEPETEQYRPAARASFIAPMTGTCVAAEVLTLEGGDRTMPAIAGQTETTKGERAYIGWVLYDKDELQAVGADPDQPYRIGLRCQSEDGTVVWSRFYAISPGTTN